MPLFKFDNETEWLAARSQDITSTEVAALFGLSPYKTKYQLWHEKAGLVEPDFEETPYTIWGKRLQNAVVAGICEDEGMTNVEDLSLFYLRHPTLRLGASMDAKAFCPAKNGSYLIEAKTTTEFSERLGWTNERAPTSYEFQIQTQMILHNLCGQGYISGMIAALDSRKNTRVFYRTLNTDLEKVIEDEVGRFWESIQSGNPPSPDYVADDALLARLRLPARPDEGVNLSMKEEALNLMQVWKNADIEIRKIKETLRPLEDSKTEAQNRLLELMGNAEKAVIGQWEVNVREYDTEDQFRYGSKVRKFNVKQKRK